jgi:hypothetical protein
MIEIRFSPPVVLAPGPCSSGRRVGHIGPCDAIEMHDPRAGQETGN